MALVDNILAKWEAAQAEANRRNEERYRQALEEYDKIIQMYSPGGAFGKGFEAQLERGRIKSLAQGTQALVSSGLYGTTMQAGLGKKFEEEVATPARLQLEDLRMQRLAGARQARAGLIERREDVAPSYALMAQLAAQAAAAPVPSSMYAPTSTGTAFDESSFGNYGPSKTFNATPVVEDDSWRRRQAWIARQDKKKAERQAFWRRVSAENAAKARGVKRMSTAELMKAVKVVPKTSSYQKTAKAKPSSYQKTAKAVSNILYSPWM